MITFCNGFLIQYSFIKMTRMVYNGMWLIHPVLKYFKKENLTYCFRKMMQKSKCYGYNFKTEKQFKKKWKYLENMLV